MKIALVMNDDFSMWHFRKGLISTLVQQRFDVYVITPPGHYVGKIKSLGVSHIAVPMKRFISPLEDFVLFVQLYRIFRRLRCDIVHTMTIKPNVYGTFAAKLAGAKKIVGLVSGAGYVFSDTTNLKQRLLRFIGGNMYRLASRFSDRFWFQNGDDLSYFTQNRLVPASKALLIKSGGINLDEYSAESVSETSLSGLRQELNLAKSNVCVAMISARMVWSKGVKEFVMASKLLAEKHPYVVFLLVGPLDHESPEAVTEEYLKSQESENLKMLLTLRSDVKEIIVLSDIIVLPSYYREGVPRVLLEALALRKPVVTTDNVGCREVVENGKNGFTVPIKDHVLLAKSLEKLIVNPQMRQEFGSYSRKKAGDEFNEKEVVRRIITELYGVACMI